MLRSPCGPLFLREWTTHRADGGWYCCAGRSQPAFGALVVPIDAGIPAPPNATFAIEQRLHVHSVAGAHHLFGRPSVTHAPR